MWGSTPADARLGAMSVELHRSHSRPVSRADGRETRHSLSFGEHYDPANPGFGPMVCHNDDVLAPTAGYPDHPHSSLEIVTWVLEGALVHTDATGARHVLEAGRAQVLSAGSGTRHSEVADAASGRCRFVQVWLRPDDPDGEPSYVAGEAPGPGSGLHVVVGPGGLPVGTARARLSVGRLAPGERVALPDAPLLHVFAATGAVAVGGVDLHPGDAVRLTDVGGLDVVATDEAELLAWSFGD